MLSLEPCVLGLRRYSSLKGLVVIVDARVKDALLALLVPPQSPLQALLLHVMMANLRALLPILITWYRAHKPS